MKNNLSYILISGLLLMASPSFSATAASSDSTNDFNILIYLLVVLMVLLALVIGGLSIAITKGVKADIKIYRAKNANVAKMLLPLLLVGTSIAAQAQDATAAATPIENWYTSTNVLLFIIGFIAFEVIVIFTLLYTLYKLVISNKYSLLAEYQTENTPQEMSWFEKFNDFVEPEKEHTIDMGHEYDGIRELDNKLPGWWLYGFYGTIVFAFIYMWYYHVNNGPSSKDELAAAMLQGEKDKATYLAKSASSIDESSVKLFKGAAAISSGKEIFTKNCLACHGNIGQGAQVGPNLVDDYWIHGGKINDVFKTIKYGYPEKGMRSWKDDLSPMQMAQVASYVKSLRGSNPAGAKEKQGELYTEQD